MPNLYVLPDIATVIVQGSQSEEHNLAQGNNSRIPAPVLRPKVTLSLPQGATSLRTPALPATGPSTPLPRGFTNAIPIHAVAGRWEGDVPAPTTGEISKPRAETGEIGKTSSGIGGIPKAGSGTGKSSKLGCTPVGIGRPGSRTGSLNVSSAPSSRCSLGPMPRGCMPAYMRTTASVRAKVVESGALACVTLTPTRFVTTGVKH
jgi:hypothetical protein